jgi:hypothetical protein
MAPASTAAVEPHTPSNDTLLLVRNRSKVSQKPGRSNNRRDSPRRIGIPSGNGSGVSEGGVSEGGVSDGSVSDGIGLDGTGLDGTGLDGTGLDGTGFGPREEAPDEGLGGTFMSQTTP